MRKQIASFLLMSSVLVWGVWCGGQYFNEARVVPKLLSNPPNSVIAYNAIKSKNILPFFFPLNPLIFLLSLMTLITSWKWAHDSRKWLIFTVAIGFAVSVVLILYLAPLIGSVSRDVGIIPDDEIITKTENWKLGNRVRLIAEFLGFICSIIALRVWSAEATKSGEIENVI